MPSFKPVIRKNVLNSDNKANIKIRISHNTKVRYIKTTFYIDPKNMGDDGKIKASYPGHVNLNQDLMLLQVKYNKICADIGSADIKNMSINALVAKLKSKIKADGDFITYTRDRIVALQSEGRLSLADLYKITCVHLKAFNRSESVLFKVITPLFLKEFEAWLRLVRSAKQNTVRNYMCNIRAIYNHAIDNDVIEYNLFPFRKYKISQEKKRPRSLDVTDLKRLLMAQPYLSAPEKREIDTFFLMFYTGGTNLKDLLFLKTGDFYKGRIIYVRFKTDREYSIKVFPEAKEILDRYPGVKYLLSFMDKKEASMPARRKGYEHKDMLRNTNKYLKLAGEAVGLKLRLNTYVARYSFATIAAKDTSKDVIAQILGHGLNTMTDLYIDFDQDKADKAIEKVIKAVSLRPIL